MIDNLRLVQCLNLPPSCLHMYKVQYGICINLRFYYHIYFLHKEVRDNPLLYENKENQYLLNNMEGELWLVHQMILSSV